MELMSPSRLAGILACVLASPALLAKGDGSFQAPLLLPAGSPGPVTVHAGDLNHDGKLDLLVANGIASNVASGSPSILILFQDPANRLQWKPVPVSVGVSSVFVQAGDYDGDGFDDLVVADTGTSAYFIHSRGDTTFGRPQSIPNTQGSRWIAIGDWDNDGNLDLASANLNSSNITVMLGDGTGKFTLTQSLPGSREHTMEACDYDGDGILDLILGTGLPGITPLQGQGNGTFVAQPNSNVFSCVEYIATGDLNNDGACDLATTCIDDGRAYAAISLADGTFRRTLGPFDGGSGTDSTAIADLDADGNADVAIVSNGSTTLWVFCGKGDGTFFPTPALFGPTGIDPVFLIARDLDGDGLNDVISADESSLSLSIFWGTGNARFLESGLALTGFSGAKGMGIADLDGDSRPDIFLPSSSLAKVLVYLKPGSTAPTKPSLTITTAFKYTLLEAVDLDGDGVPDLAGANSTDSVALIALLSSTGAVKSEVSRPTGLLPSAIKVGLLDEGNTPDLAIACAGSGTISLLLNQGAGIFGDVRPLATVDKVKMVELQDLDRDGRTDIAVISPTVLGVHYGSGGGDFAPAVVVVQDSTKGFTDVAAGDVNGDGFTDLLVSDQKTSSVLFYPGKGNRTFGPGLVLKVNSSPVSLRLADLDGDGFPDITTSNGTSQSVSIILSRGAGGFAPVVSHRLGFTPLGHRLADLDGDGALDLFSFTGSSGMTLLGRPRALLPDLFIRGDANSDGQADVADVLQILLVLFAGRVSHCMDALDANDDGQVDLSDALALLGYLFQSAGPLPPPFPLPGADPTADGLDCKRS
jgi:hypothetical protein